MCVYVPVVSVTSVFVCVSAECCRGGYPHGFQRMSAAPSAPKSGAFGVTLASQRAITSKVYSMNGQS